MIFFMLHVPCVFIEDKNIDESRDEYTLTRTACLTASTVDSIARTPRDASSSTLRTVLSKEETLVTIDYGRERKKKEIEKFLMVDG